MVFHEGGDFCGYGDTWGDWLEDCRKRSLTDLGSSRGLKLGSSRDLYAIGADIFADDPDSLVYEWNWVYMLYCDGHFYAGANLTAMRVPVPGTGGAGTAPRMEQLYFRGRFNVIAVLGTVGLLATASTGTPTPTLAAATDVVADVLVHGCSSGAIAVFCNADFIRSILPPLARVAAAGIPVDRLSIEQTPHRSLPSSHNSQ